LLRLIGWQVEGDLPPEPRFVLVVHPHTSNWDVPIGLICAHAIGLLAGWPYGFMVKDSALRWPVVGALLHGLGGIGIDRSSSFNAVEQMVAVLRRSERLMLAITPEGTRRRSKYWKSGFYYIALGARVPIVLAYIDYARRTAGLGPVFWPTGDVEADLEYLRAFYADKTGLYPHEAGEVRFKPETREKVPA
jgi:1-acyl-sn-glycerol-3-phosphate acyltransferase